MPILLVPGLLGISLLVTGGEPGEAKEHPISQIFPPAQPDHVPR